MPSYRSGIADHTTVGEVAPASPTIVVAPSVSRAPGGPGTKDGEVPGTGGRAIPELWLLGTEALALAMEVPVLEAKRLGHRAVLRLSWLLLVASVALSTLLQVAVAPPKC